MTIKTPIAFLIFILIIFIPLFAHLDSLPLAEWDESHLAGNAFEMHNNHNWIVTMNNGSPEMWNTKPPLMIWLQALSMKVFGVNELAVRLPSALAALGTCLLLFFFFSRRYKEPLLALLSVAVLVTSEGYVNAHGARSGDFDSLFTLFMVGYAVSYFLYLEEGSKKYICLTVVLLILAALTKGVQSLMFLPGLFIYTIYKKKLVTILKQKELYLGIAAFIFFVIGYYLLREHYNTGYIKAVWENELGGRYSTALDGHKSYPLIYYDWLKTLFNYWYLWVLPGVLYGIFSRLKWLRDFSIYIAIVCATYFFILSSAQTAVCWYAIPAYPFLSVFVAIFIYTIFNTLADMDVLKKKFPYTLLPCIFLLVIFYAPYTVMKDEILAPRQGYGDAPEKKQMELLLQDVLHNRADINGYYIADMRNDQQLGWYYKVLVYEHHPLFRVDKENLVPNTTVLAFSPEAKQYIAAHFNSQIIHTYYDSVIAYKLMDRK